MYTSISGCIQVTRYMQVPGLEWQDNYRGKCLDTHLDGPVEFTAIVFINRYQHSNAQCLQFTRKLTFKLFNQVLEMLIMCQ